MPLHNLKGSKIREGLLSLTHTLNIGVKVTWSSYIVVVVVVVIPMQYLLVV
jgi:hypothetical protein